MRRHELRVDPDQAVGGDHVALSAVDPYDSARDEAPFEVGGEFGNPPVVPAVGRERVSRRKQ